MVHRSESELVLDDIVFADRNKEYGAFSIRRSYNSHLKTAIIIASAIFCSAIIAPFIGTLLHKNDPKEELVMKEVVLSEPPPLDPSKPPPPPPPPPPPVEPPKVATTKFLPPKIMEDEKVQEEEPPPIVDSIKGNTAAVTQEGTDLLNEAVDVTGNEEVGEPAEEVVLWVAEKPTFQGDYVKFLQQNIKFPAQAANNNISGRVVVEYILEKDGTISSVKVLKGIGYGCDEEAVRVVKLMSGKWSPGKNNGHSVKFKTMIPILFKLPDE